MQIVMNSVKKDFYQAATRISVLKGITQIFKKGSSYAIIGASGSGKSTLLHIIAGLDVSNAGEIFYDTYLVQSLNHIQRSMLLSEKFGLVFQDPYLIKELSVIENIILKGLIAGNSYSTCYSKAQDLLKAIGLLDKAHMLPAHLSGGQQQRVALARALLSEPDFLIADEPTGSLDAACSHEIIDLILSLQHSSCMGMVISTHNSSVAARMDYQLCLDNGQLILC